MTTEPTPGLVRRVLDWLRAGYPDGIPPKDYQPVLALLRREHLSDDDIGAIAHQLVVDRRADDSDEPISTVDAGVAILRHTNELPSDDDIRRVADQLATHGWPFNPA